MPPLTPSSSLGTRAPASSRRAAGRLAVVVLQLPGGDFLERDREVVLRRRIDHRRRKLVERALAEVVVVGGDLACALRGPGWGAGPAEPQTQSLEGRRRDEDLDRLRQRRANLARPLDLDLEHDGPTRGGAPLELGAQRPVAVTGVAGVLDELARRDAA